MKLKVYIASPYTKGWTATNVRRQLQAKHILLDNGFCPFAPLENHYAEIFQHRSEKEWFAWDLEWLKVCNILVRIRPDDADGNEIPSSGSDEEVQTALDNAIAVYQFKTLDELKEWAEQYPKIESVEGKTLP